MAPGAGRWPATAWASLVVLSGALFAALPVFPVRYEGCGPPLSSAGQGVSTQHTVPCPPFTLEQESLLAIISSSEGTVLTSWGPVLWAIVTVASAALVVHVMRKPVRWTLDRIRGWFPPTRVQWIVTVLGWASLFPLVMHFLAGQNERGVMGLSSPEHLLYTAGEILTFVLLPFSLVTWAAFTEITRALRAYVFHLAKARHLDPVPLEGLVPENVELWALAVVLTLLVAMWVVIGGLVAREGPPLIDRAKGWWAEHRGGQRDLSG